MKKTYKLDSIDDQAAVAPGLEAETKNHEMRQLLAQLRSDPRIAQIVQVGLSGPSGAVPIM